MRRKTELEVEIVGGLGNQLFGYAAGLFLSQKSSSLLKLNLAMIGAGGTDHGKTLRQFAIPSECLIEVGDNSSAWTFVNRIANKLSRHFNQFRRLKNFALKEYTATDLGYEEEFWNLKNARKIRGYFQTYLYADTVLQKLRQHLVLTNPSDWFLSLSESIELEDPIAIHIRRGDYLKLQDEFGVLDISYYVNAMKAIGALGKRNIWIFTDSPQIVETEIRGTPLENSIIIEPPLESTVNESLLLMSKCRTLVISNSTFSWWAAYLNSSSAEIYAPSVWFKGRAAPAKLIPPAWNLCESIWR